MSSSPPGSSDAPAPRPEESVGVVSEPQALPGVRGEGGALGDEQLLKAGTTPESRAQEEVLFLLAEAEASDDNGWAARVYFEAAYLQESALGQEKAAARTYAKALTVDPTFQPTAWSLRRQLGRQGHWENLVRVIEAEARFASNTRSQDRADLLVERGLLLTKHLSNPSEGAASFAEAVRIDPKHRVGWVALFQHALWHNLSDETHRAFEGLLANASTPTESAAWTVAFAEWLLVQGAEAGATNLVERSTRACDVLLRALSNGITDASVFHALDRFSVGAAHDPLRLAALDAWDFYTPSTRSTHSDAARILALREKARRLVARGDLVEAAGVLDRALLIAPDHPVVAADRLDLAVLSGRVETFDAWQARSDTPSALAELLLRRSDMAMRQGAWGEAMGALGRVSDDAGVADLCFVERVRTLAALQDAHGIAQAYETQADSLLSRMPSQDDDRRWLHEVAHQYVRAGALWESELADSERAETLYSQALALLPSYRPAQEGLASVFTRDGRWDKLVELVASDAKAAATSVRASALRESLVLLNRDLLHDLPAALAAQNALTVSTGDDARNLFRRLDLAALLSNQDGGALDDALAALAGLQKHARTNSGKSALWILSARLAMGTARDAQVDGFLDQALSADPLSLAAAFIERRSRLEPARVRAALSKELSAAVRAAQVKSDPVHVERVRALRFRQAFVSLEAGQFPEALASLDPLVRHNDIAAWCWQVDVLRRVRDPILLRKHLANREGASDVWSQPQSQLTRAELFLLLGECCELSFRRAEAADAFEQAARVAQSCGDKELIVRCLLGCLRMAAAETNIAGTVSALQGISEQLDGALSESLAREAQHILLATGGVIDEVAVVPGDVALSFLAAARSGNAERLWVAMNALAEQSSAGNARARLRFQLGVDAFVAGKSQFVSLFSQSYADEATSVVEVAVTDMLGNVNDFPSSLDAVFSSRLARLTAAAGQGDQASGALAALLALERASLAESEGRLGAAAAAYALVLELRSDSLEALEGLRRLAQLAGARADEALLLERIGDSLTSITASAAHYAEAALLAEADGQSESAVGLFYKVLARAPNDDEAFDRLLSLLRSSADWPRVENLLGFKLTRLGHKGDRCVPLWLERANLRQFRLNDSQGAYADWQRSLATDGQLFEPLWRLGQACVAKGATWAARARLHEATQCDCDNELSRLTCFVDLAEVCEQQLDVVAARNALDRASNLIAALTPELWSRLLPLCTRLSLVSLAVQSLRSLAVGGSNSERAAYLVSAARTLRDAEQTTSCVALSLEAIAADPHGDGILDLAAMAAPVALTEQDQGVVLGALFIILEQVSGSEMFDVRTVELLEAYSRVANQPWRQKVAAQLLFLLGQGNARGSSGRILGSLDANSLFSLGRAIPQTAEHSQHFLPHVSVLQSAWSSLATPANKAWAALPNTPVAQRSQRIDFKKETRLDWFQSAASAVGLNDLSVFSVALELGAIALGTPLGAVGVSSSILGGDAASRFRAGRSLALQCLGLPFHTSLNTTRSSTQDLVCSAIGVAVPLGELAAAADTEAGLQIAKHLPKKILKSQSAIFEALGFVKIADVAAWLDQCERAADRFGLLVAGDVAESAFVLAGSRQLETVKSNSAVRSLVAFAISNDHNELLRTLGMRNTEERRVEA